MFKLHSVIGRVFIGMMIGLFIGVALIILLPTFYFPLLSLFGFGSTLLFMIMGVTLGFLGMFERHPAFDFKTPWWIRGIFIGALFMLMYICLSYDSLVMVMNSFLISWTGLTSPFWFIIDGTIIGLIMSYFETKFAGEGIDLPRK